MSLRKLTVAELRRELARREKGGKKLLAQHRKLSARLAELDAELGDLGVTVPTRRGRRLGRMPGRRGPGRPKGGQKARGGLTLIQALEKGVRTGSTVSPAEAAQAAKRAGYKTASKTFGIQVATALAKAPGFKKTGRGQYLRTATSSSNMTVGRPAKRGRRRRKSSRKAGRPKGSKHTPKPEAAPG
jgi:hypothetical protein